jgi:hypothetical protein
LTAPNALGAYNSDGDGTLLEGKPGEILDYVDRLHAYAHRDLDGSVECDTRFLRDFSVLHRVDLRFPLRSVTRWPGSDL